MKKRLNAMNWLKKYSKLCFLAIFTAILPIAMSYAEVLTGEIRKEITQRDTKNIQIPYNEPKYSTGAILAYNKGIEEYKFSNYDNAIEAFKYAIKQEPRFADAYFNLGVLYEYFSDNNNALIAFNRAYAINKRDYEALYYVIKCYVIKGDNTAASYYLSRMPKNSEFYQKAESLIR